LGIEIKKWSEYAENRYAGVLDHGENEYRGRACAACSPRALRTPDMRRSKMTGNELKIVSRISDNISDDFVTGHALPVLHVRYARLTCAGLKRPK
jgi:hypothetical protein